MRHDAIDTLALAGSTLGAAPAPKSVRPLSKKLSVALWTAQVLLAALFLFSGSMKLVLPLDAMKGPIAFPGLFVRFLGTCEVLGALGLILPGLLRIRTELTAFAALGLTLIMIGAVSITVATMPGVIVVLVPLVTGCLTTFVAYNRWPHASSSPR